MHNYMRAGMRSVHFTVDRTFPIESPVARTGTLLSFAQTRDFRDRATETALPFFLGPHCRCIYFLDCAALFIANRK
jgi:hypothetical protein